MEGSREGVKADSKQILGFRLGQNDGSLWNS